MNPNTKIFTTILSLTILAAAGYAVYQSRQEAPLSQKPVMQQPGEMKDEAGGEQKEEVAFNRIAAENYLRENINSLSPEKPVLGGTFYVTEIKWTGEMTARTSYEDGHIALDATVVFAEDGSIQSFMVDPEDTVPQEERRIIEEPASVDSDLEDVE